MTLKTCAVALSVVAATVLPTAASAQLDIQNSPVPRYHLAQVSADSTKVALGEFKAKTEEIRSCRDAKNLAKELDADYHRNRFVLSTRLPGDLQDALKELPQGHATQVFSNDGSTMRVIVLCYVA